MMDLPQSFISALEGAAVDPQMTAAAPQQDLMRSEGMQGNPSPADVSQFLP